MSITLTVGAGEIEINTYVPGTRGATGPVGSVSFELPTEIDISSNHAIASVGGYAVYADASLDLPAIGISMEAIDAGGNVNIQSGGKLTITGAGWTDTLPVYVSTVGALTQTKPTSGFIQEVGVAIGTDILLINIQNILIDGGNFT